MSGDLKLTPEQVQRLEQAISNTADEAHRIVLGIGTSYQNVVGSSWSGSAATAASSKQQELEQYWSTQLKPILENLQFGLVHTRQLLTSQDEDSRAAMMRISADGPSGMATNFSSRL